MRTPTTVTFRGDQKYFSTQKEAYIRLVEEFSYTCPDFLQDKSITEGREVNYFARSPQDLSPKIAEQDHNYLHITLPDDGRWFVNVKLENSQKLQILRNIAKHADLVEGRDWSWDNGGKKNTHAKRDEALARAISEIEL
jgi:hypothetical protein